MLQRVSGACILRKTYLSRLKQQFFVGHRWRPVVYEYQIAVARVAVPVVADPLAAAEREVVDGAVVAIFWDFRDLLGRGRYRPDRHVEEPGLSFGRFGV